MELTETLIRKYAQEYMEAEPLAAVEEEHVEILPDTFASSEFGRRDVQWVVQWYFRRYLGAYPDQERRTIESKFRENDFEAVLETLSTVAEQEENRRENLRLLTGLDGVDVSIASAFLQFTFPQRFVTVDQRTWWVLQEVAELDEQYPDPPSVEAYLRFDDCCQELISRFDVDAWTLYRGLWRAWKNENER